jgi:translocator protein
MKNVFALVIWIGLSFVPAVLGSRFLPGEWYAGLAKPSWTPPGYLFGPVWTLLYTLMGVSAWLVWKQAGFAGATPALTLFLVQLVLNGAWSWIFFGMHKPALAFFEIIVMWVLIFATLLAFWRVNQTAGLLLIPYLAWVSFATALNFALWQKN